jgi:outer membrane protein assembly factor BamA
MLQERKYFICVVAAFLFCSNLFAQAPTEENAADTTVNPSTEFLYVVGDIVITGNKKTKQHIILREIPFKTGEEYTLAALVKKFEDARRQLMNTALFHNVTVAAKSFEGNKIHVTVSMKERWYLFPLPYLKPVDRNLNQWIVEQNASLSRVNYGAKLLYANATGRNDKLKVLFGNGYTKQLSFSYDRLYIDKKLKWGMNTNINIGKNREINYNTVNDKQVFLKDKDSYLRSFARVNVELTYRRAIKTRHSFGFGYTDEKVKDTVIQLNPSYFNANNNRIRFPELYYTLSYLDLDYIPYPTKGYAVQLSVGKRGFNRMTNLWSFSLKSSASWHLWPKTFLNLNAYGGIKAPFKQPYYNQRFLGYGDVFMQGYEYYVIDGVAGGYLKTTLTREVLNFNIRIPPIKKGKEAQHIPVRIFAKIYGNTGYVYNPEPGDNLLSNTMLYSGGFGIDILTFYDVTFKLEWTFNQLGQNGIFVHRKSIF